MKPKLAGLGRRTSWMSSRPAFAVFALAVLSQAAAAQTVDARTGDATTAEARTATVVRLTGAATAITSTHKARSGMKKNGVAHFEIYADDPDALQQFYSKLFDWTIQSVPGMDYRFIQTVDADSQGMPTQPGGINGGMAKRPDGHKTRAWMSYVNVESLDTAVEHARQLGARVMREKSPVPGMGWFAMLTDPQGNEFAMWQTDPEAK